jgi:hypothetical protein
VSAGRATLDTCEVTNQIPEMLVSGVQLAVPGFPQANGVTPFNLANVQVQSAHCRVQEDFLTQLKLVGIYTVPRMDVVVSGTYQNMPGPVIASNVVAANALITPSLGRPLSGGAPNATINIVEPGTMYGDRINQLDVRFSKIVRFGGVRRATVNVDLANALNASTIVTELYGYNPANPAAWRRPNEILQARFVQFGVQLDF